MGNGSLHGILAMITDFRNATFLIPKGFDPLFGGAAHCLAIKFELSDCELCLLIPVIMHEEAGEESIAICWASFSSFSEKMAVFRVISSMGGNTFTTELNEVDVLRFDDVDEGIKFEYGKIDINLSVLEFSAVIYLRGGSYKLEIVPSGFLRIMPDLR